VHSTGTLPYDRYYYRDSQGRITESINIEANDSDIVKLWYASPSLGMIDYAIEQSGPSFRDSAVYTYNQDRYAVSIATYIISATPVQFGGIDSFTYDAMGNLTQLQSFTSDGNGQLSLNIGYDFEYDIDINPLFSSDDSRLPVEWYTSASPNNLLKQINHYGNPPLRPDDDVTVTYQYRPDKKPSTSARGGTALSTNGAAVVQSNYYYQ
jgi:hypothetical protein